MPGGRDPVRRVRRTPKDSSMLYQAHCELNGGRYDRNVVSLKADFTVGSSLITQSITLWQASSCRQCHCCTIRNHCHNTITGASIIGGLAYRSACDEGYINYPDVRHANQAAPVSFFATAAARVAGVPRARSSGWQGCATKRRSERILVRYSGRICGLVAPLGGTRSRDSKLH